MSRIEKALEKANQLRESAPASTERPQEPIEKRLAEQQPVDASIFKGDTAIKGDSPCLVTLNDTYSPVAEEYRKLKSMVVKITNSGQSCNTLMVASAIGGEGKSITALNLAISLAQEYDHTVMLVDADLRRPSLDSYLGITAGPGLSECLAGSVDIKDVLIKTGVGKLVFLSSGAPVSNPAELLSSGRMREFITEIKHRYPDRYIIIDTPPVLLFAEAHSLATMVDGVLFVVKEDLASQKDVREALVTLRDSKVLGLVYNATEGASTSNHYQGYGYGYPRKA
ncbi:MAG: XrtA-associated tyrosine autokinase [Nitrospirota bacterium]|nr:XrtA-associated tyrosine autokinase [Nitrospirota bacterium]